MRGRKSIGPYARTEIFTMRLTKEEKAILDKDKLFRQKIVDDIRKKLKDLAEK